MSLMVDYQASYEKNQLVLLRIGKNNKDKPPKTMLSTVYVPQTSQPKASPSCCGTSKKSRTAPITTGKIPTPPLVTVMAKEPTINATKITEKSRFLVPGTAY